MFEKGRVYRRAELHHEWAGTIRLQQQGGILTPRGQSLIVAITGDAGEEFGYADHWDEDGVFHYYGAGQRGDMQFARGNLALRDHGENGKDVYLFEEANGGIRYRDQMVVVGYYELDGVPDADRTPRRAIVFQLTPLDDVAPPAQLTLDVGATPADQWSLPLADLLERAGRTVGRQPKAREAKAKTWNRSEDLRIYVRRRANGRCEGCGNDAPFTARDGHPYREPHHTRRLTDGGPDDFHHVIALCPACHRRVHHGRDGVEYNETLKKTLQTLEPKQALID
jgi:5-methylcytosine-specific restriction enzyme A